MNQEGILQEYLKTQTECWLKEDLSSMIKEFPMQREKITEDLSFAISRLCRQARLLQETDKKGPAGYLCISFLRTNVLEDNWQYRLELYDENYYLDRTKCDDSWVFVFVWKYLEERLQHLRQIINSGIYVNKIRSYHMDEIKLTMAEHYHQLAINFTQGVIREAIKTPEYGNLVKAATIRILMGEYLGNSVLLYEKQCDTKEKSNAICNITE